MITPTPVPVCDRYSTWKSRHAIAAFTMNKAAESHRASWRQRGIRSFWHDRVRRLLDTRGPAAQVVNVDGVADAGHGAESTEPGVLLRIRKRIVEDVGADRGNAVQRGAALGLPRRWQGRPANAEPADIGSTEVVQADLRDVVSVEPRREILCVLAPVDVGVGQDRRAVGGPAGQDIEERQVVRADGYGLGGQARDE